MYIREFRVRNYMVHQDTTIPLFPLTVFVGPNGGGKSALFDALLNFSLVSRGNIRQAFAGFPYSFNATRFRGASRVARIGFRVVMAREADDPESLVYEIDYHQIGMEEDMPQFAIPRERVQKDPGGMLLFDRDDPDRFPITQQLHLENDRSIMSALRHMQLQAVPLEVDGLLAHCSQQISRFNRSRLDPSVLAQPSRIPELLEEGARTLPPRLGYHGEDLASTLYYLNEASDPALEIIRENLRELDDKFTGFDFNTVGTDRVAFSAVYSDQRGIVSSSRLSSGTLIYLGLMALVAAPSRPSVLMIEEPENGLTPQAVKSFYKALRGLAFGGEVSNRAQVLISSHSPFVICEAWNGEDRDFIYQVKVEGGRAVIRKFSEAVKASEMQLRRDKVGERTLLGLVNAEEIMSG